jgi:hypothetical protein
MTDLRNVKRGDVVRFKGHALRVEAEPRFNSSRTRVNLSGRENRDGCPMVSRWYFTNLAVEIEKSG